MTVNWSKEYCEAAKELDLAKEQYRLADTGLAQATARLSRAEREFSQLFRMRVEQINADRSNHSSTDMEK